MSSVDRGSVKTYYADQVKDLTGKTPGSCAPSTGGCCKGSTKSCCPSATPPDAIYQQEVRNPCSTACDLGEGALGKRVKTAMKNVHPDILSKSFGCGSPFPPLLDGCVVIDLGSGTGRDCFVLSQLVGQSGKVVGVDMTPEMLSIAKSHLPYHAEKTNMKNVEFREAVLEDLVATSGLAEESFDIVTSNCVVNLTSDKAKVFKDVFRLLKPGGEMYFSDVYALTEIPDAALKHVEAWSECYSGALPLAEFSDIVKKVGFLGPFVTKSTPYLAPEQLKEVLAGCSFVSDTVRLVKPLPPVASVPAKLNYVQDEAFTFAKDCRVEPNAPIEFPAEVMEAVARSRYAAFFKG